MILIEISFILYVMYNLLAISFFGVPSSLSNTFYLYKEYKCQWVFSIALILMAGLLMPSWLSLMDGSPFQFLSFLVPMSIVFVAISPNFKNDSLDQGVHFIATIIAAALALAANLLVFKTWLILTIVTLIILLMSIVTKTLKSSWLYWVETIVFLTTYITIICKI